MAKLRQIKDDSICAEEWNLIRGADGNLTMQRGAIMGWTPSDNDPNGESVNDDNDTLQRQCVALLESIPIDHKGIEDINRLGSRKIIALQLVISRLNRDAGFKRFAMFVGKHTVTFRHYESVIPRKQVSVVKQRQYVADACPLCNKKLHFDVRVSMIDELNALGFKRSDIPVHWDCYTLYYNRSF